MNNVIVRSLVKFWDSPMWMRKIFAGIAKEVILKSKNPRIVEYLNQISDVCKQKGVEETRALKKDILMSFIMNGMSPTEYFLFKFPLKTWKERDEYLSDAYRTQLQKVKIGIDLFKNDLINKFNFYTKNVKFFKRECIKISSATTYNEYVNFIKSQNSVFIKLNAGSFGYNAHIQRFTGGVI